MEYKLYNSTGDGVITKSMAEKIAGSGLTYTDLSTPGLISILSKPLTKDKKRPRVTKTANHTHSLSVIISRMRK